MTGRLTKTSQGVLATALSTTQEEESAGVEILLEGQWHDDDDDDDDGVYLKAVSCEFLNLQIIRIICKCEVMM